MIKMNGDLSQYRLINGHYGTPKVFEGINLK
mgnify:FL=1